MEESTAPQAEAATEASRPSEHQPAAGPALASFADAIAADVNHSEDREASEAAEPKPAPTSGDVRSGGRRSQAARANEQRIAELERQLAERDPERIRAELAAEQQRAADQQAQSQLAEGEQHDAERYASLRDVPDRDLSDEDYRWRENRKATLALVPGATKAARAQAQAELRAERAALHQELDGTWSQIKREMAHAESKPFVEKGAIIKGASFGAMADHLYEAGRRSLQPELDAALEKVRRLEADSRQFRLSGRNGLGAARAPLAGGRSAAHANGRPDFRTASSSQLFEAAIRASNGDDE